MDSVKFSIITPSIGRTTIIKTIESIRSQGYENFEHIIVADGDDAYQRLKILLDPYKDDLRIKLYSTEQTKNFGNYQRRVASEYVTGNYVMYLDDDDWYLGNAFHKIANFIIANDKPFFGIYPCLRASSIFFNQPPGSCMTVSCQYFHRSIDENGERIKWLEDDYSRSYLLDGAFVDYLRERFGFVALHCEPLVQVDYASSGSMEPIKLL